MHTLPQLPLKTLTTPKNESETPADESDSIDLQCLFLKNRRANSRLPQLSDKDVKLKYYSNYHNIHRRHLHSSKAASPAIALLKTLEKEKLHPLTLGLVKSEAQHIKLNFGLSDRYAGAFSKGLRHVKSLEAIDLKGNRLSQRSSMAILSNITSSNLRCLNLAGNTVGHQGIIQIIELLKRPQSSLTTLNLEGVQAAATYIASFCDALKTSSQLEHLNLARTGLKASAGKPLGEMLATNSSLRTLDLHWNMLHQGAGQALFEGLEVNSTLIELDFSWNALGTNSTELLPAMAAFFEQNDTLRHIDISFNSLGRSDCEVLAKALAENHTLKGIHVLGNACQIDALGFMQIVDRPANSVTPYSHRRILSQEKNRPGENCWLCERWRDAQIILPQDMDTPLFLCLSIDGYAPFFFESTCLRAVPPTGATLFLCTVEGKPLVLKNLLKEDLAKPLVKDLELAPGIRRTVQVTQVNTLAASSPKLKAKPRPQFATYVPPAEVFIKDPWDFNKSVFRDYILDSAALLDRCFEFDWYHSKIPNLFKSDTDLAQCKALLRQHYQTIKNGYKMLSTYSFGEYFSVSLNTLFECLSQLGVLNSSYVAADYGINWNSTIIPKIKKQKYNPGNALARYEFLEIIVRIANDKYIRSKQSQSLTESVTKLLQEMDSVLSAATFNSFRTTYFCEEVDTLYKESKRLWTTIFDQFSGRKKLPDEKPFVSLEEFRELAIALGCCSEGSTTREVDQAFCFSMITQVDELFNNRHMKMTQVEFLEALARLSCILYRGDKLSLPDKLERLMPALLELAKDVSPKLQDSAFKTPKRLF